MNERQYKRAARALMYSAFYPERIGVVECYVGLQRTGVSTRDSVALMDAAGLLDAKRPKGFSNEEIARVWLEGAALL